MTDQSRDLIQRLTSALDCYLDQNPGYHRQLEALSDEARAYLAAPDEPAVADGSEPTDEERFEHWWYHEGSAPPRPEDDCEEHTHRTSKIAWLNGAALARRGSR